MNQANSKTDRNGPNPYNDSNHNVEQVDRLIDIIEKSKNIVFFGGAGTSTESGIPDFRSVHGLYAEQYDNRSPEEILSIGCLMYEPVLFFRYLKERLYYPFAAPSGAHMALAELERHGVLSALLTQNIDGLHQKAGSNKVIELHGSFAHADCMGCKRPYPGDIVFMTDEYSPVPKCVSCGATVRPRVTLYGESLDDSAFTQAIDAISSCDTLIVGGTSLTVYPAAGLIRHFKGSDLVLINKAETRYDGRATLTIRDNIGEVLVAALNGLNR